MYGRELVHSAQAIDLRKGDSAFRMSAVTQEFYNKFRKEVGFMETDRPLSDDFGTAEKFLRNYK